MVLTSAGWIVDAQRDVLGRQEHLWVQQKAKSRPQAICPRGKSESKEETERNRPRLRPNRRTDGRRGHDALRLVGLVVEKGCIRHTIAQVRDGMATVTSARDRSSVLAIEGS